MKYTKQEIIDSTKGAALIETYVFKGENHRIHTDNIKYIGPGTFDNQEIEDLPYIDGEADVDIHIIGKEEYEASVLANSSESWPEDLTDEDKIAVIIINENQNHTTKKKFDAKLQDLYNRFEEYNFHQMDGEEVSFEDYVNGMTYEPGFFRWLFDDEDLLDYEVGDPQAWEQFMEMVKRESVEPIRDRAIKEVKNWEDDYLTELIFRSYLNHSHEWIEIETNGTIHEAEEADNNTTHWIDYPNKEVANIYNIHMESAEACNTEVCILYRDFEKMDKESFIDRHSLEEWEYVNDTDFKEAVIEELHCNSVFEDDVREEIVENIRNIKIGYFDDEKN